MQIYMCCIFRHLSALFQEVVTRSQYFPARPTKFVGNVERTQRKMFSASDFAFSQNGKNNGSRKALKEILYICTL